MDKLGNPPQRTLSKLRHEITNFDIRTILNEDEELRFFYFQGIPQHWWKTEGSKAESMITMFSRTALEENLCAAYAAYLRYWLTRKWVRAAKRME